MVALYVLDGSPDWDALVDAFDRASRLVVRLRQRVVAPTLPVSQPVWAVDPDFDLEYHMRRVRVRLPGTLRDVLDLAETAAMTPLDRARPLWEVLLVDGVAEGRAALIVKLHHAIADGVAGLALNQLVFDHERRPGKKPVELIPIPEEVTPNDVLREGLRHAPEAAVETAGLGIRAALGAAGRIVAEPRAALAGAAAYARSVGRMLGPSSSEPSPLLRARSLTRRFLALDVALEDLKRAGKAAGCSVNDAYLATLLGGFRLYHEQLGVPVEAIPVAVPISLRREADPLGGNRWAGVRFAAPVGVLDPGERMRQVRELVLAGRNEPALGVMGVAAPILSRLPSWLLGGMSGTMVDTDLQASSVRGDPRITYVAGAKVERFYPFGPLPGAAVMVVMVSSVDTCGYGVNLDPAAVTDAELFAGCLQEGIDEVVEWGRGSTQAPRAAAKPRAEPAATR
jgi:diacylglycerol O-acyltransferase